MIIDPFLRISDQPEAAGKFRTATESGDLAGS